MYEPNEALTILFVLSAALNLLMLFTEGREREIRTDHLGVVLAWALPGLVAGALILEALSKPTLQIAVGVAVVVAVAVQMRVHASRTVDRAPGWAAPTAGLATGVLSTTTGTSGPPLVLLFAHLGFTPAQFRDTLAAAFMALNVLGIAALGVFGGGVAAPPALELSALLGLAVLGQLAGRRLYGRLAPDQFRAAGLILVVCAGIASVVAGLSG